MEKMREETEVKPPLAMSSHEFMNEQVGALTVSVSCEPLGVGGGKAHAEITTEQEALELADEVAAHVRPISEGASTGCGDGRELVNTITGEANVISPKLFGGSANAAAGMRVIAGAIEPGVTYEDVYYDTADTLVASGRRLGAHIDTHAHDDKSDCGSLDGAQAVFRAAGENGEALQPLVEFFDRKLGFAFNETEYVKQTEHALAYANSSSFDTWNGMAGIQKTVSSGGLVRVLDGGTPGDPAHGHRESLIVVVLKPNVGIDKEALVQQTGKQVFIVTLPQLVKKAELLSNQATPFEQKDQVRKNVQAGILFQLAHALVVPDGSQYLTIIE